MAGDTIITIIGNLTAEPELRFTPSGAAVANFTIASTPRQFDRQSNEWKDGETLFMRCSVWREAAENVAETLQKGMRVIAQGRLKSRSFDTKEGDRRTVMELDVDEIGPSLRFASAKVNRQSRGGGSGGGFSGGTAVRRLRRLGQWRRGRLRRQPRRPVLRRLQPGRSGRWAPAGGPAERSLGPVRRGSYDWGTGQDDEPPF
uniref:single-stranded DNA-binding protein n=1 Tax=Kocuria palustris TaxID=71999 RepID=UPI000AAAC873